MVECCHYNNLTKMSYSKTFAFLLMSLLGWLGVSHIATEPDLAVLIDNIIQVVGLLGAFWARYKAGGVTFAGFKK